MTADIAGFSIPDFIPFIYFPILILEKEPVFPFLVLSAKQGNYWYHFYNGFGMTRSLTGDWTQDLPHLKPALYHYAILETVLTFESVSSNCMIFLFMFNLVLYSKNYLFLSSFGKWKTNKVVYVNLNFNLHLLYNCYIIILAAL